jgi:hypothetical protein
MRRSALIAAFEYLIDFIKVALGYIFQTVKAVVAERYIRTKCAGCAHHAAKRLHLDTL